MTAQLALCAVGLRPLQAAGAVMYFDRKIPKLSFQMLDHRFLVLGNDDPLPFDSSLCAPGIDGLAPDFAERHPELGLALVDDVPSEELLAHIKEENPEPQLLCYVMRAPVPLQSARTSFAIDGPVGAWLEAEFGDQQLIWGKAIGMTAHILEGTAPPIPRACIPENQLHLWQWLAAQPDQRDFLFKRIWGH